MSTVKQWNKILPTAIWLSGPCSQEIFTGPGKLPKRLCLILNINCLNTPLIQKHSNFRNCSKKAVKDVLDSGRICILDVEIEGVKSLKKTDLNPLFVFIKPPSMQILVSFCDWWQVSLSIWNVLDTNENHSNSPLISCSSYCVFRKRGCVEGGQKQRKRSRRDLIELKRS